MNLSKLKITIWGGYIKKRIIKLIIPYELINFMYIGAYAAANRDFPYKKVIFSVVYPYFNRNAWYIFALFAFNIIFYAAYKLFKGTRADGILWIGTLCYLIFTCAAGMGNWWFVSCLPFVIGVMISKYKKEFFARFSKMNRNTILWNCFLFIISYSWSSLYMDYSTNGYMAVEIVSSCWFCFVILMVHSRFTLYGRIWKMAGEASLYILLLFGICNMYIKPFLIGINLKKDAVSIIVILLAAALGIAVNGMTNNLERIFKTNDSQPI